jgi:hypothetical protein
MNRRGKGRCVKATPTTRKGKMSWSSAASSLRFYVVVVDANAPATATRSSRSFFPSRSVFAKRVAKTGIDGDGGTRNQEYGIEYGRYVLRIG